MNYRDIQALWGKVCPLDRALWGNYHRFKLRRPECMWPTCRKESVYRFTDTGCVEYFCEQHSGFVGCGRLQRMWKIIEQWDAQQREDYE